MDVTESNKYPHVSELAETFPSLTDAPGVRPFDAEKLDAWRRGPISPGEADAAAFVLSVFNGFWEKTTRFSIFGALSRWDAAHRSAFLAWAMSPWWP